MLCVFLTRVGSNVMPPWFQFFLQACLVIHRAKVRLVLPHPVISLGFVMNGLVTFAYLASWMAFRLAANVGGEIDFNTSIRPILAGKYFSCHGSDAHHREARLRITYEGAKGTSCTSFTGCFLFRLSPPGSPCRERQKPCPN